MKIRDHLDPVQRSLISAISPLALELEAHLESAPAPDVVVIVLSGNPAVIARIRAMLEKP